MKILVTGANGFIGKNLICMLKQHGYGTIYSYDIETEPELLDQYAAECDFVFHLAGVNRPEREEEFMEGNFGFTSVLLESLKRSGSKAPILITSSIQAALENPYGRSKKAGEELIFQYGREQGVKTFVYRLPNAFGKWCRPNYNSAVATFCHNIARGLPITVNDRAHVMSLVYIDDLAEALISALEGRECRDENGYCVVPVVHTAALGELVDLLYEFRQSRETRMIPDMTPGSFSKKLYSTYLSYLPEEQFRYPVQTHADSRGSFTELFRTKNAGQVSVNISKPGIVKGNHWHHTKNEKFAVVSGTGVIRFRKPDEAQVLEYFVSGDNIEIVDIPVGYTHNIENLGDTDLVTVMWCNECFDQDKPDTYFLEV